MDDPPPFASHRKINRTKKWSKVYIDDVHSRVPIHEVQEHQRAENMTIYFAKNAIAKKMHQLAKVKLYDRTFSCKRTMENLHPPKELGPYRPHWKSSVLCDVCYEPALHDSVICKACNVVIHSTCHYQADHSSLLSSKVKVSEFTLTCRNCHETMKDEEKLHESELSKVLEERRLKLFGKYLSKIMYTHVLRRRFLRQRAGITLIQAIVRGHVMRKKFIQYRRRSLRVLYFEASHIPRVDGKSLIVFTAFDPVKNMQLFRVDRQVDRLENEGKNK
jgi:hypothetical protein